MRQHWKDEREWPITKVVQKVESKKQLSRALSFFRGCFTIIHARCLCGIHHAFGSNVHIRDFVATGKVLLQCLWMK